MSTAIPVPTGNPAIVQCPACPACPKCPECPAIQAAPAKKDASIAGSGQIEIGTGSGGILSYIPTSSSFWLIIAAAAFGYYWFKVKHNDSLPTSIDELKSGLDLSTTL